MRGSDRGRARGPWVALAVALTGCDPATAEAPPPPARVERHEQGPNTVVLQAEAERRLAITLTRIERRPRSSMRTLPGQVLAAPNGEAQVVAPLAGTIALVGTAAPVPGRSVGAGEPLLVLLPVLGPVDRIQVAAALAEAEGLVARGDVMVQAAEVAHRRVEPLVASGALAARTLEEAIARLDEARAARAAAVARRNAMARAADGAAGPPIPLASPIAGVLRELRVTAGQVVPAGTPCADVVALRRVRVRVQVPRAELPDLALDRPARIRPLAGGDPHEGLDAAPVPLPPPTVGLAPGCIDLHYELEGGPGRALPGERVAVEVPRRLDEHVLVAPWAAVVQDAAGGQWLYVLVGARRYERRRVQVLQVDGELALLDDHAGVVAGASVAATGAAELHGIEYGVGQ